MSGRTLVLVKHSLPEIVPTLPPSQWRLSDVGRARCESLAEKLSGYRPDVFVSSVEFKALETAQILASRLCKPAGAFEGLHEHDRTNVEFVSEKEFDARAEEFFLKPRELVWGRETADQAHARFAGAVERVIEEYAEENVAIIAHGTVITLYVSRIAGLEPFAFWKRLGLPSFVVLSLPKLEVETIVEQI